MRPTGLPAAARYAIHLATATVLLFAAPLSSALAQTPFDHDRTGYHLDGAHATARCLSCHGQGILRGAPKLCNQCHIIGNRAGTTVVQGQDHVPVNVGAACNACHISTASFRIWRMDHSQVSLWCSACHSGQSFEGVVPKTKTTNHPVVTADCSFCHTSTTSFAAVSMSGFDHVGVAPGTCLNCHGRTAMGQPVGHMPVPANVPCDACHRSTTTFTVWSMASGHAAANIFPGNGNCSTCHGGQSFLGVTPTTKPGGHIATTAQCDTCHTSTLTPGGFALTNRANPHPAGHPPTTNCQTSGCHDGITATGQITGHIPTTAGAQCGRCHSSTAANFGVGLPNIMNHAFVNTTPCATCHGIGRTFPGVTMVTLPAGHIPTSADCSSCHSNTTVTGGFKTFSMNHTGITTGCINCHGTSASATFLPSTPALVTKPVSGHIPTSAACENCHPASRTSAGDFSSAVAMNHTSIVSGCNLCHDTGAAFLPMTPALVTKPAGAAHIPTGAPCEWCHTSTTIPNGFKTQSMNHTGIVVGCNQCHKDKNVPSTYPPGSQGPIVGQPASHITTTGQDCAACHTSTLIPGGFRLSVSSFDHVKAGVQPGTCTNCHNGTAATGPITGHIPINVGRACDACHAYGVGGFARWNMNHIGVPANCTNCHAGSPNFPGATMVTLTSKGTHFPIGANQCSACHTVPATVAAPGGGTGFATWTMSHAAVSSMACSTCHASGASWVGAVPIVTYPASGHIPVGTNSACGDCHTASDTPGSGGFKTFSTNLHNSTSVTGIQCKTCHDLGKSFIPSTPALVTRPASGHIPLTAGTLPAADCNACHTSTAITGGFATWSMPSAHFGITTNCVSCHSGTFPGVLGKISGHLQTTANCESCHTSTTVPGGFATTTRGNPHQVTPVYSATTTCQTGGCHDGVSAMGQTASHIPTTAGALCGRCHSWTAASFAAGLPGIMNHDYVNTATCSTCHAPGKTFPGVTIVVKPATHIPTLSSADCSVCHSDKTVTGGFANRSMNHAGVSASSCNSCHTGQTFATGVTPKVMTAPVGSAGGHIAINGGTDCVLCHTATSAGGFATRNMNHSGVTTASCNGCHTGQTFATGVMPKIMPAPSGPGGHIAITGATDCVRCHTSTSSGGFATRRMDHAYVNTATCNGCHTGQTFVAGVTPRQKPAPGHIPVTGDCSACHTNMTVPGGFVTWSMSHTAVNTATCAACHSAANAGTFMASTPAIVTPPASHTGAFLLGKDCSNSGCHSAANTGPGGFALAGKIHTAADAGRCNTCHGVGGTATKTQALVGGAGHIPTGAAQCDQCHNYPPSAPNFGTWTMRHSSVAATPCSICHSQGQSARTGPSGSVTVIGIPAQGAPNHVTLAGSAACNLCHTTARDVTNATVAGSAATSGFATQGAGWTMNHAGVSTTTCTGCHTQGPAGATFATGVVPVFKPANHVPYTPSSLDCKTCHSSTTSFKVGSMSHTGISNGCQNCHGNAPPGIAFANVTPTFKPVNHIATTGLDCSGCHVNTSTFTVRTMNHGFVNATTCNACHTGQTFATGVVPRTKGANHITTSKDCATCHTGFVSFAGGRMGTAEHIANGNTATCTACHGGQAFQGVTPVAKPGNHIPTSGDCALCHSTSNFAVGAFATGWNMNHSGIVLNCIQCHNGTSFGTSAPLVPVSKANTPSPGHVPTSADCSNCHNVANSSSKVPSLWSPIKKPQAHNATLLTGFSATVCYPCHGTSAPTYFGVMYECGTAKGAATSDHLKCSITTCGTKCHKQSTYTRFQ